MKDFLKDLGMYTKLDINFPKDFLKLNPNYDQQKGIYLYKNIALKVKPFTYGRSMFDFYPVSGIACGTSILGILANGSVVPCCRAFDDTLSIGNIKNDSLYDILEKNTLLFKNIRQGKNMHGFCQKCLGAPTKRGAFIKKLKNIMWKTQFL